MLRLRRRCAQTARISLHVPILSKSVPDTKQAARRLQRRFPPCIQCFLAAASATTPSGHTPHRCFASSSVSGYLRITPNLRKRENDRKMTIFSAAQENLGFRHRENPLSAWLVRGPSRRWRLLCRPMAESPLDRPLPAVNHPPARHRVARAGRRPRTGPVRQSPPRHRSRARRPRSKRFPSPRWLPDPPPRYRNPAAPCPPPSPPAACR